MGLFATLASATNSGKNEDETATVTPAVVSSSASIPTVVQLYSKKEMILMDETPSVSGYSSLTYQAVQVGGAYDAAESKHRHTNPDLGVWNCRVDSSSKENSDPLVDSLLALPLQKSSSAFCLTVDLSEETAVEPTLSALQAALVRHLIEHPPQVDDETTKQTVQTTSLYDLQTAQFGLATEEPAAERAIEESARDVKIGLMICAVVSSSDTVDESSSETAFRKKQALALLVYHLRKFANSIHAALCFVERPGGESSSSSPPNESSSAPEDANTESSSDNAAANNDGTQISISYDKLSQLWRDMATGVPVWEEATPAETGPSVRATALYGPGRQQEDLIETLLLRNANYPGHWDASKDSLWVALPSETEGNTSETNTTAAAGDDGWLTELRDSIASALPTSAATDDNTPANNIDDKPKEKDAAVSSFFESLLKNP